MTFEPFTAAVVALVGAVVTLAGWALVDHADDQRPTDRLGMAMGMTVVIVGSFLAAGGVIALWVVMS